MMSSAGDAGTWGPYTLSSFSPIYKSMWGHSCIVCICGAVIRVPYAVMGVHYNTEGHLVCTEYVLIRTHTARCSFLQRLFWVHGGFLYDFFVCFPIV